MVYTDTEYPDDESGLYLNKFNTLAGKTVKVKVKDYSATYSQSDGHTFTSSAVIQDEGDAAPHVTVKEATYDMNGNVKVTGTYDEDVAAEVDSEVVIEGAIQAIVLTIARCRLKTEVFHTRARCLIRQMEKSLDIN